MFYLDFPQLSLQIIQPLNASILVLSRTQIVGGGVEVRVCLFLSLDIGWFLTYFILQKVEY